MPPSLEQVRAELPVTLTKAYMNSGTSGPLPQRAVQAMHAENERQLQAGRSDFKVYMEIYFPLLEDLRSRFAQILGTQADEVSLTHHTTEGINIAVWGLDWRPGDEIVTTSIEHEGGLFPVYQAARRFGLGLRVVDLHDPDRDPIERLSRAITSRTRLVVISHVDYQRGRVLPLAEITRLAHENNALVAVDGAQSAGAIPVDVKQLGIDFYTVSGQKWLCGPEGVGALYVRKDVLCECQPTFVGFFSMRGFGAYDLSGNYLPASGARRFEVGTVYWPGLFGMRSCLQWFQEELGMDWVYQQGADITRQLRSALSSIPDLELHSGEPISRLTTFSLPDLDPEHAVIGLAERGVVIRSIPETTWLRVSTSYYNNQADIQRLCEGVEALRA